MAITDLVTAEQRLKYIGTHLQDREWRLDSLYKIKDPAGGVVPFVRNAAQRDYWLHAWYLNIILKARQLGFSTLIEIMQLDMALFNANTSCGLIDYTLTDARKKLEKIKFSYERLPPQLTDDKAITRLVKSNSNEMHFANGSMLYVGTSHRGDTLQSLHVSELGRISVEDPNRADEIKSGAFNTIHSGQYIHVESTAKGRGGLFYEMVQQALKVQKEGRALGPLDFKLHFYAWLDNINYSQPVPSVPMTAELNEYFRKLEGIIGRPINGHQRNWFAAKIFQIGPDDMKSEFPSTPDEAFETSLEGAYYKSEMTKARADKRIGELVPYDPSRRVNTFWDLGMDDYTSIIFHQTDGVRHRLIDYYENSGEGLPHYAKILRHKQDELGYIYGTHYGPHDMAVKDWSGDAKQRKEIAEDLGIKPWIIADKPDDKADAIEAVRQFLAMVWFDSVRCSRLVDCLDNFSKKWNDVLGVWRAEPLHNWASHAADALQTGVLGFQQEAAPREKRIKDKRKGSAWSA